MDAAGCEFDADGGFAVEVEFVAREAGEEVRFADAGVPYEDDFEEELYIILACYFVFSPCLFEDTYIIFVVRHGASCGCLRGISTRK